jgi:DNA-binding FadR family transcriptional regulator
VTATSSMFHPITTQNAFEAVVEQVRTAVDLALLVPGDRLPPERELAAMFDVSRPTVREALRVLAMSGYVGIRRGSAGGAYVLERPRSDQADRVREDLSAHRRELSALLEWRRVVEAEAAALAATRISDDQLRALRARLVESGGRHVRSHGLWRAADSRFHIAIAEATGNPYMLDTVRKVRAQLAHALDALILLRQAIEPAAAHEHEAILAALQARDPDLAMATATLHGRATEERLYAFLGSL